MNGVLSAKQMLACVYSDPSREFVEVYVIDALTHHHQVPHSLTLYPPHTIYPHLYTPTHYTPSHYIPHTLYPLTLYPLTLYPPHTLYPHSIIIANLLIINFDTPFKELQNTLFIGQFHQR